jgi:hypothetical protein
MSGAPAAGDNRLRPNFSQTRRNLERLPKSVKQKKRTSADFLGVLAIP